MGTKRQVIAAEIVYIGIKKRCRKVDKHRIKLGDHSPETLDKTALIAQARAFLLAESKSVTKAYLYLTPNTIEETDTCVIRGFEFGVPGETIVLQEATK